MARQNRVTPTSAIVAADLRGTLMGNRGCLHRTGAVVRQHVGRRWIICLLEYRGWRAPQWVDGRYTPLFFHDEAVALAAGHRPCALCQRARYDEFRSAWASTFGNRPSADELDLVLHEARLLDGEQRTHTAAWSTLPTGTFVSLDGPALVLHDRIVPWSLDGYGSSVDRPPSGTATVLTPAPTVEVLRAGFVPRTAVVD